MRSEGKRARSALKLAIKAIDMTMQPPEKRLRGRPKQRLIPEGGRRLVMDFMISAEKSTALKQAAEKSLRAKFIKKGLLSAEPVSTPGDDEATSSSKQQAKEPKSRSSDKSAETPEKS
jgi:hypothetical protein